MVRFSKLALAFALSLLAGPAFAQLVPSDRVLCRDTASPNPGQVEFCLLTQGLGFDGSKNITNTLTGDVDGAASANDLDEVAVEAELEAVLDVADLQGFSTVALDADIGVTIQAWNAGLDALAAFNTNGILVQTAVDTFAGRTITGTANEVDVSNGNGVAGNPTIDLPATVAITTAIELSHATANTLLASSGHLQIEGATVWDSGNDGSGSGLDADTLDTISSAAFALDADIGTTIQAWDADLDSWRAIARATGFDAFTATPSMANLGSLLTDEAAGWITFGTTPSSANLQALLTDELDTGVLVFLGTPADDQVAVGDSATDTTWRTLPDSDAATQKLQYDVTTNAFSAGTDDDVPDAADYSNLTGGTGITNSPTGTINLDTTEVNSNTWGSGTFTTQTFDAGAVDPVWTYASGIATLSTGDLRATTAGTNAASVVTVGGTQTLTNKTLTAPSISTGYVATVADGTGIDGTATGDGSTYTPTLDFTEISSLTWGAGAFTTMTFNAGAVDPVFTFGSGTFDISAVTATTLDDEQELRFVEEDAGGSNYVGFKAPAALTASVTCTFENDANPIPDSCVGDGSDAGGAGSQTPWLANVDADGFSLLFDDSTGVASSEVTNAKILDFVSALTAVNYWILSNSATTGVNRLEAAGVDAAVAITIASKSTDPINFEINAATELSLNAASLDPGADDANDLGTSSLGWQDVFITGTVEARGGTDTTVSFPAAGQVAIEGKPLLTTINIQTITVDGTYTPTSGAAQFEVVCTGQGGGGGGGDGDGTHDGGAGGGGSGGTARITYNATEMGATATVVIGVSNGAGGSATNGTSGTAGEDTTFDPAGTGATITGSGGLGGTGTGVVGSTGATVGGAGGAASGGEVNIAGSPGSWGHGSGGADQGGGPGGGPGGGVAVTGNTVGTAGTANTGGGGGGAATKDNTAGRVGGAGGSGICFVKEYIP